MDGDRTSDTHEGSVQGPWPGDPDIEGVFTIDRDFRITSLNYGAQEITGFTPKRALGRPCYEIFRSENCKNACMLKRSMESGEECIHQRVDILDKEDKRVTLIVNSAPIRDKKGKVIGGVESFRPLYLLFELRERGESLRLIYGQHPKMRELIRLLPSIARSDAPVLIQGETGTGKHLVALNIHYLSRQSAEPFVRVNCGAFREDLLDREIFGCRRSSFHKIEEDRAGSIEHAHPGTLYLSEIDQTSHYIQMKLLQVLEDRVYEPVGANHPEPTEVRLIASANRKLDPLVEKGAFRKDLYYRLNVFKIEIPPIRERKEDIPSLIDFYVKRFNEKSGKGINGVSVEALPFFLQYTYPGNIMELENIVEHACILTKGDLIQLWDLPNSIVSNQSLSPIPEKENAGMDEEIQKERILDALRKHHWNRKRAARELGIDRTTLWRKMKRLGLAIG